MAGTGAGGSSLLDGMVVAASSIRSGTLAGDQLRLSRKAQEKAESHLRLVPQCGQETWVGNLHDGHHPIFDGRHISRPGYSFPWNQAGRSTFTDGGLHLLAGRYGHSLETGGGGWGNAG